MKKIHFKLIFIHISFFTAFLSIKMLTTHHFDLNLQEIRLRAKD